MQNKYRTRTIPVNVGVVGNLPAKSAGTRDVTRWLVPAVVVQVRHEIRTCVQPTDERCHGEVVDHLHSLFCPRDGVIDVPLCIALRTMCTMGIPACNPSGQVAGVVVSNAVVLTDVNTLHHTTL